MSGAMTTRVENDKVLVLERVFNAPRELVFQMFKDPEHLKNWWGPRGWEVPVCKMDFRPGGIWLPPEALEASAALQWPMERMPTVGTILLVCTILYAVPRTALLGAVLLTGYFGGAIASHVRVGNPLFTHTLFPIYVAAFVWGGLYLRNATLRRLFP